MAITLAGIQWILISVSVSSNSLIIREGSTGELVIAKEVCILNIRLQLNLSKKNDGVLFLLLTLLVSTILDETLMAKAKQNGVSGWALMVRRRTSSLNFESKCTLYQSKHYLNFSWSQSTQFVSPHKKFDVLSKALFFRRF